MTLGDAQRGYWLRTAAVDGVFTLEGLNKVFSGHFTNENEPGHQFDLELTGLYDQNGWKHSDKYGDPYRVYVDILGPIRSMLNAPGNPGQFVRSRGSLPVTFALDATQNKDYSGKEIVRTGTPAYQAIPQYLSHAAAREAPIGVQTLDQAPPYSDVAPGGSIASALTGARFSYASPRSDLLRDFQQQELGVLNKADQLRPDITHQVMSSPQWALASPDERRRLLQAANSRITEDVRKSMDVQNPTTRRADQPFKYAGITSVGREQQIDDLISKYDRWVTAGRHGPSGLTPMQVQTAQSYKVRISPRYSVWEKANRTASAGVTSQVDQLVGAGR